jgi:hypothetical protein
MRGRTLRWIGPAAAAAIAAFGAAAPAVAQETRSQRSREPFRATLEDRQSRTLALGDRGTLLLSNIVGDITVRAAAGSTAGLDIVRRARGRSDADARRGLERVTVAIDEQPASARVEVVHPQERNAPYSVSVDYVLTAPPGTRLTIRTVTGRVEASGFAGEMTVTTTTGDIAIRDAAELAVARTATGTIRLVNVRNPGVLEAATIAGSVILEQVRARRLVVGAVAGDIRARDAEAERADVSSTTGDIEYAGPIAADGRYDLRSHSGDIRFTALGGSGYTLRASTIAGSIRPAADLGLVVASRSARALRGAAGTGTALVLLSTFSGDILVLKR